MALRWAGARLGWGDNRGMRVAGADAGTGAAGADGQGAEQQLVLAHRALLKTRGLQFDFSVIPQPKAPAWLEPLVKVLTAIGPALVYVFWGGVIVGALMILYFLVREFVPDAWFKRKKT